MARQATYQATWLLEWPPNGIKVEQVYGVLFNETLEILVCNDNGRYNLPGGKPEGAENWLETLQRECLEEAQVEFSKPMYLGYVKVDEFIDGTVSRSFAQVRFIASITALHPPAPDPATGKTYDREFHGAARAAELLAWGHHGTMQLRDAERLWRLVMSDD